VYGKAISGTRYEVRGTSIAHCPLPGKIFGGKLMLKLITESAEETSKIGEQLGRLLSSGNIICLSGDL
jgi:hypothetical protein